jgi:hypothetical protein
MLNLIAPAALMGGGPSSGGRSTMPDDSRRQLRATQRRRQLTAAPPATPAKLIFVAESVREFVMTEFPALRPFVADGKITVDDEIAICIGPGTENVVTADGLLMLRVDDVRYTLAALLQFFRLVQGGMAAPAAFQGLIAALSAKEVSP